MELMEYQYTTRDELLSYQEDRGTSRLFLSVPATGQQTAVESLQIWKGLTKEIKAQHPKFINFKQVRTSVITHWLKQYNLRQVQYMAGHRYVSSTERYKINDLDDLKEDISKYYPL